MKGKKFFIGDVVKGKISKITVGSDKQMYITLEFEDFHNTTVRVKQ